MYGGMVAAALVVAAYFTVNADLPAERLLLITGVAALVSVPCFWASRWWLGWRYGSVLISALLASAILIKYFAEYSFGRYEYSDEPTVRVLGTVAWTFTWTALEFGAFAVAANLNRNRIVRIFATAVIAAILGLALHPGILEVSLPSGSGWFAGALIGALVIDVVLWRARPLLPAPAQLASGAVFIVIFWAAVCDFGGLPVPAVLRLAMAGGLVYFYCKFHYAFDDKVVFVDESNNPIGTGDKLPSHTDDTQLHRAFSVFLFDPQGRFLMQQRALSKKTWPGVWSNSCCGHVMLHEATEAAAERRLMFELGLTGIDLTLALPKFRYRAEKDGIVENEICPVFVGVTDRVPRPNPAEVESVKWVDWDEFVRTIDDPETDISPWAVEEVKELLKSDVFRSVYPAVSAGVR